MQFDAEGKLTIGQRGSRLVRLHAIDEQPGTDVIGITGERLLEVEIAPAARMPAKRRSSRKDQRLSVAVQIDVIGVRRVVPNTQFV